MTSRLKTLVILTSTAALAHAAIAERTRIELTDPARPPELRVEIEWGSIRITGDPAAEAVIVDARPDRPGEIGGSPITAAEQDNQVTLRQAPLRSGTFRSANLEIRTPPRTDLTLVVNRGGDVRVEDVRGLVEVTNLNGSVELAGLAGAAAVNASNGAITAGFATVEPDRDMIFSSLNGSIELCLPPDYSGRLHLTTAGDVIRSDFPIGQEEAGRTLAAGEMMTADRSEVRGRIGAGGALLRVSTLNGEIRLARCD